MTTMHPTCSTVSTGPFNQLVNTFVTSILALHCNITNSSSWPDDYGKSVLKNGISAYDFVIVGAGTSGSVVASRLAENSKNKVLLIEAGGDPPMESEIPGLASGLLHSKYDWKYPTVSNDLSCLGLKNESCIWSKGKMLGGTSSMNTMYYLRGVPSDYNEWEEQGNPLWGWSDVLPYFKKSEDFEDETGKSEQHGVGGPLRVESFRMTKYDQYLFLAAASERGHNHIDDFADGNYFGFGFIHGTVKEGRRMSSAKAFLLKPKKNLHIIKNALAYKINFDSRDRVQSVNFTYSGQNFNATAKREVIISAGAIETPKLLMLSGIGPATHLKAMDIPIISDVPVGSNLMDHVVVAIYMRLQYKYSSDPDIKILDAVYSQLVHKSGSFGGVTLDVQGFLSTKKGSKSPNIQYMFQPILNISQELTRYKDPIRQSILKQISSTDRIFRVGVVLMRPQSRGFVRLHSNNYTDDPIIIPNSFQKDSDMESIVIGIRRLAEFENTTTMKSVNGKILRVELPGCDLHKYRSSKYWECYAKHMTNSVFHPAGTTKMGSSRDYTSVVDSELRVRGVRGLRVIDASIIPSPVSGDTNVASIMIAERGAEMITRSTKT